METTIDSNKYVLVQYKGPLKVERGYLVDRNCPIIDLINEHHIDANIQKIMGKIRLRLKDIFLEREEHEEFLEELLEEGCGLQEVFIDGKKYYLVGNVNQENFSRRKLEAVYKATAIEFKVFRKRIREEALAHAISGFN